MSKDEEIEQLKEIIKMMQKQINMLNNHIMAISPLATPEQKKNGYDMYMSQLRSEAVQENNDRSFRK